MTIALLLLCALGTVGTLFAEHQNKPALQWVAKPLAAIAFILAAWHWGALNSDYGRWIFAGLVFGALGDVLLIPKTNGLPFLAGMLAFLLGHLFYAVAFWGIPQHGTTQLVTTMICVVAAIVLLRWMMPGVPRRLRGPVGAYNLVIFAMVVLACGATGGGAHWSLAVAAIAFALSDVAVARNRFVAPGFINRLWGLPLYFSAQMLMASTVLRV